MIVDFQHHYTPKELFKDKPVDGKTLNYDKNGVPSYIFHPLLYELDAHIEMMDVAGIDAAVLSCAEGMCNPSLEACRFINDKMKEAERRYPGRFIGTAHAYALGGKDAFREMARCADLGFPGIVITSEFDGKWLDSPDLDPFWAEASRLGLYVFVHPTLKLSFSEQFDTDDIARAVGREFSLVMATIRMINGGVFDRHPNLRLQMAHLSGGIASMLGRIRGFQDREFWGTAGNPKHGAKPEKDFDYYLRERLVFDTAGFCGAIGSVKTALVELSPARIVFATYYPQEIRTREPVRDFVNAIRALGRPGEQILSGNVGLLLPTARAKAAE